MCDGMMKHNAEWDSCLHILFVLQEWCERRIQPCELGNRAFGTLGRAALEIQNFIDESSLRCAHLSRTRTSLRAREELTSSQFLWKFTRTLRSI